jgi:flavin reductase (DIM6/NTAB) family NADH-FMN oxidoreductase RutF
MSTSAIIPLRYRSDCSASAEASAAYGEAVEAAEQHVQIEPSILYFGTPVVLLSTLNEDGSPNLAPMSSAWALGYTVMLGLGASGKTLENLRRERECVINLPDAGLWRHVERLAPLTGRDPVHEWKAATQFRFEPRKFDAAGLTPQPSERVGAPRVLECPLQLEATVRDIRALGADADTAAVETEVVRVHAAPEIVIAGTNHVDPHRWTPLLYVFRHYVAAGERLGKTFRAET